MIINTKKKSVLITGGTSGLGKSIVKQLLIDDFEIVTIGKRSTYHDPKIRFFSCDLAVLEEVQKVVNQFENEKLTFDILINNAGILSPPDYHLTQNGFELSYQVNFLSHVLLTRLLIQKKILTPELIVNVSSPIYNKGKIYLDEQSEKSDHGIIQTYANTKLYMALFSQKLSDEGISSFSFNPGTFSSGIYRSQKKWFHRMYKLASPFMVSSEKVSNGLYQIIKNRNWSDGKMMDKQGRSHNLVHDNFDQKSEFWQKVDGQIRLS